ncbi:hypothetical protein D3C85_551560 [compost metagenome]
MEFKVVRTPSYNPIPLTIFQYKFTSFFAIALGSNCLNIAVNTVDYIFKRYS